MTAISKELLKAFDYRDIPFEMQSCPHWVLWVRYPEPKKNDPEHMGKAPINAHNLRFAMTNNPETWSRFDEAVGTYSEHAGETININVKGQPTAAEIAGIGFVLKDSGFVGIDIDDKPAELADFLEGTVTGITGNIMSRTRGTCYAEISQSGKGVHIFARGKLPGKDKKSTEKGLEMYQDRRFLAMTGDTIPTHTTITDDISEELSAIYAEYFPEKPKTPAPAPAPGHAAAAPVYDVDIGRALRTARKTNPKFADLYNGDIAGYTSFSEARGALLMILVHYLHGDAEKIEQAYKSSSLYNRDAKFDSRRGDTTLGKYDISTAIEKNGGNYFDYNKKSGKTSYSLTIAQSDPTGGAAPEPVNAADAAGTVEISETTGDAQSESEKPVKVLPWYFYENSRGDLRVDPAKLLMHIQKKEHYFWVASGAMDGVRRYFYNDRRGVYEWLSDDRIKGRIRNYISSELPTAVKAKDINETFNLLILDECRYSDSAIDDGEHLVNFENGFYNIETGQILPHSSGILSTIQLPLRFDPTRNYTLDDAPNFKQYITTITEGDTEKQTLMLEYMGAALSNVPGYKFKSALFLVGAGNTGKSKYIELIYSLLGEGNFASISFADLEERFQSGAIYGKRLVCDADMKVQRAKGNSLFMKITGGDPVQIEYKGMNPFTTKHRGFLLFASNAMPRWSGNTTDAAYNRMMIIECNNVIPPERQDPDLLNKLLSERRVIVSLALNALRGAVQRGYKFTRPATMTASINKLRRDNCPSIDFFETCCTEFDDANRNYKHCMKRSDMHRVFVDWCRINAPSAYIPGTRDFYRDILQYKQLPDGSLIKIWHGHRYYTFTLTLDAKEQFHVYDNVNDT